MSLYEHLKEIKRTKYLSEYYDTTFQFLEYLKTTNQCFFRTEGIDKKESELTWNEIDYVHRWTTIYRRKLISKLYQLEEWYQDNPSPLTLASLTTYHGIDRRGRAGQYDISIEKSFEMLYGGWEKLRHAIKHTSKSPYLRITEPHETGYPHFHVILFEDLTIGQQNKLKTLWSKNYGVGDFDHGLDFETRNQEAEIRGIKNYVMKYIAKGFISTGTKYYEIPWTAPELVYNALIWKNQYRTFQPSRDICKAMAYKKEPSDRFEWFKNALIDENGEEHVLWDTRKEEVKAI